MFLQIRFLFCFRTPISMQTGDGLNADDYGFHSMQTTMEERLNQRVESWKFRIRKW